MVIHFPLSENEGGMICIISVVKPIVPVGKQMKQFILTNYLVMEHGFSNENKSLVQKIPVVSLKAGEKFILKVSSYPENFLRG